MELKVNNYYSFTTNYGRKLNIIYITDIYESTIGSGTWYKYYYVDDIKKVEYNYPLLLTELDLKLVDSKALGVLYE